MFSHIAIDDELHTKRFYEQITYILLVILLNWNHVDFTNKVRTKIPTSYIQIKGWILLCPQVEKRATWRFAGLYTVASLMRTFKLIQLALYIKSHTRCSSYQAFSFKIIDSFIPYSKWTEDLMRSNSM